jgi:putative membrane protein
MERPQNIIYHPGKMRLAKPVRLIILFHLIGLIGLLIPVSRPLFLQLVPFHLLFMLTIIGYTHKPFDKGLVLVFAVTYIAGFIAEWVGVHKSWLFGHYSYGQTLGVKLFSIPLIMGINWFLLIYATGISLQYIRLKNQLLRILTGALILVLLDILIEPVAIRFDYWHWDANIIPIKNYVCWFLLSAVMLFVFEKFNFNKQSLVGPVLLLSQFIFFAALQ